MLSEKQSGTSPLGHLCLIGKPCNISLWKFTVCHKVLANQLRYN